MRVVRMFGAALMVAAALGPAWPDGRAGASPGRGGAIAARGTMNQVTPDPRGEFTPLTPARVLDTRTGLGTSASGPRLIGPGETLDVQIAGRGGVPASGASAVVFNATLASTSTTSWLAVFPAGGSVPFVSNLNYSPGSEVANMVTVALGDGGQVGVFNAAGQVHVVLDVVGYYADAGGPLGARFLGVSPQRAFDTRGGIGGVPAQPLGPGGVLHFDVTGVAGVPASGVTAVVVNLTAVQPTSPTWLAVYPDDVARPDASSLNLQAGTTVPNLVTVRVPASGVIDVFNAAGFTHVIGDVMGYYTTQVVTNEGRFIPVVPQRVFDSRIGDLSRLGVKLPGGVSHITTLDRNAELAATGATAAVLNVTVTEPDNDGWLAVFPGDDCTFPSSSNLNYTFHQTIPNSVVTRLASLFQCEGSGPNTFALYTTWGTHVVVDLFGYFTKPDFVFGGG